MNKFAIIGIVLVVIVVAGVVWKEYGTKGSNQAIETGVVKEITVVSKKLQWRFEPEVIEVEQGDRVKLTVINEDDFDHGFAIDALGVSQRLPANGKINVEFVASKSGEFPFYCSVSCSEGIVDGKTRGHFDHIGKFVVSALKALAGQ
jgi:nitrosocyanin